MASRLQSLFSRSAFVVLALLAACDVTPDDEKLSAPPPVGMGPGKKPSVGAASSVPAGTIKPGSGGSGTTGMMTAAATATATATTTASAADGGRLRAPDAGVEDSDAGPRAGAGGARAGNGAAGMLAAGSGGRSGAGGRAGASGEGGRGGTGAPGGSGGQGGAAGGSSPSQCQNQFCFTVFDCWLLNTSDCNYTDCVNFVCE